jgi:hypothetical protein
MTYFLDQVPGTCPPPGKCQNLMGSYICSCPPGYELGPDGNACEGIDSIEDSSVSSRFFSNAFLTSFDIEISHNFV